MRPRHVLTLLSAAVLALAGCGSTAPVGARTAPVKGVVTYKGKPLTRGKVAFEPDGAGRGAFGDIGSDGSFVLSTYTQGDGAVLGNHRVAVLGAGKALPSKFASHGGSKVEIEVEPAKAEYAIDLK